MSDNTAEVAADANAPDEQKPTGKHSLADILILREKACALRGDGLTYRQIAKRLDIGITTAYEYVIGALKEAALNSLVAQQLRELEVQRLDRLWRRWLPLAVAKGPGGPDEGAAAMCLRISSQRCKILGLDAPIKVEDVGKPRRVVLEIGMGGSVTPLGERAPGDDDSEPEPTDG